MKITREKYNNKSISECYKGNRKTNATVLHLINYSYIIVNITNNLYLCKCIDNQLNKDGKGLML